MGRAFSMIELVIVVVIAGIIAAIAVPRVSGYSQTAKERRVVADMGTLQKATEMFAAEHSGLRIGRLMAGGKVDAGTLSARLTSTTDDTGTPDGSGIFGPYVRSMPVNALNGLATVRIDGVAAGAGTHGWRYDSALNVFHSDEAFTTTQPDGTVVDYLGNSASLSDINDGVKDVVNDLVVKLGG